MNKTGLFIIGISSIILVSFLLVYFIYSMVLIDAKARGMKKPRFWAVLAAGSGSGEGLLV